MVSPLSGRPLQMGYGKARWLLLATGLAVLGALALVMYVRRVDTVEVLATLLFLPVFIGFLFAGLPGGLATGVLAAGAYVLLRYPAIEAVGAGDFVGLIASRSLSYVLFGAVGGWSSRVLESSLHKLELYDQVDDETGVSNARSFLHQTDLERSRAQRYQTMFSVVVLRWPSAALTVLGRRKRSSALRELGRLGEGLRVVDHMAHATDGEHHWLAVILPETGAEGAEVFRSRFVVRVSEVLVAGGVALDAGTLHSQVLTVPGDDEVLHAVRSDFTRVDALEHPDPVPA